MLQTAIFSEIQASSFNFSLPSAGNRHRRVARKISFARLADQVRQLLAHDDTATLSEHLLRDIGVLGD